MPIYEYICENCGVKNSFLVFSWEDEVLKCKKCGGEKLKRIISRFARLRSEEEKMESTVDEAMRSVDINNPDSIKRWMRKTLKEYSSELDSDIDIDEAVESMSEEIGLSEKKGEGSEESNEESVDVSG
jgi:putative regulatory protein, FmdB family